jgi:uncharacterized protein YdiU (UPF0061 family)
MSILGLTMDYGPYGWLEGFDLQWTPNTTDAQGRRYCYGNQPQIAEWNLARLASALAPLVEDHAALEQGLTAFGETFHYAWRKILADKLGLVALGNEGDDVLLSDLFDLLQQVETDMTLFFRGLMAIPVEVADDSAEHAENQDFVDDSTLAQPLRRAFYTEEAFAPAQLGRLTAWLRRYVARVRRDTEMTDFPGFAKERLERMRRANPKYVLRNYLAQQAIEALEQGDESVIARLMEVLKHPYDEQPEHEELADRRPEWARHKAGCSALSCSS